jgi:hypothetical protein
MKKIGIISDTHSYWDDKYVHYFANCDEIWHAGDIGDISIAQRLSEIAPLRAVSGNADSGEVRRQYKELEIFKVEGLKILLTHIGGYPGRWSPGMARLLREEGINLMVDGHSHILRIMYDKNLELLHINPGAAGLQGWQQVRTLVTLKITDKDIHDCEVIELIK